MSCELCPRHCAVDRSVSPGFCGCSDTMRIARIGLHRYEEPCISGIGGSGAVFFSGCNLRCVFCQNKVLQTGKLGQDFSPETLADAMLELQRIGAENINLVTPTPNTNGICRALDLAKSNGLSLPIVYNTNGYLSVDTVDKFPTMWISGSRTSNITISGWLIASLPPHGTLKRLLRPSGGCWNTVGSWSWMRPDAQKKVSSFDTLSCPAVYSIRGTCCQPSRIISARIPIFR